MQMKSRRFILAGLEVILLVAVCPRVHCETSMRKENGMASGTARAADVIGDSDLRLTLRVNGDGLREEGFEVHGRLFEGITGLPWAIETDRGRITPAQAVPDPGAATPPPGRSHMPRPGNKHGRASLPDQCASFSGKLDSLDWKLSYQVLGPGIITKTLTLTPKTDILLKQVSMWRGQSGAVPALSRTPLQDIAAFYRQDNRGMFVSLDFPYSRITTGTRETAVTYPPHDRLKAGQAYTCHSLTMGATALTGRARHGFDDGEVEAMDSYVQARYSPRFDRPMFVSACINNRYTMPRSDVIFYTMKDHPTLSYNHDLLKREIGLMPELGMEYYQLWTGPFDSVPGDPDPDFVHSIVKYARRRGVHVGDYSSVNALFCLHYNDYRNSLENHPEWGLSASDLCLGNPRYVNFYRDMVVNNGRRYGFEIHCLDFLNIHECNAPNHGHPPGRDSIYAQVRGLTAILEGVNSISPEMMSWSNAGDWGDLLPKLAWTNHNMYLTDPFIASPWQGLNMTRLLDDARREQMVSLHHSRFIPYRYLTNCQYFFCQNSVVPEIRNYQYGALSTVAVTPNLCLGEIRPWLDRLPADGQAQVKAFYKKWTEFLAQHYDLWKKTFHAGENPGPGALEIYGHARDDHGFVFLVNPNYWSRTVDVPLDASLGFTGRGKAEIAELYPVERLRLTAQGPHPDFGTSISVTVPAQAVIVLEIRPADVRLRQPRLYGLSGTLETHQGGYLIKTQGMQGVTERCAVLLPKPATPVASAAVRDFPKQPKRTWSPTSVKLVAANEAGIAMDVTFRREAAPTELRDWRVRPGSLADGTAAGWTGGLKDGTTQLRFPLFANGAGGVKPPVWDADADKAGLGPLANFCGAYVENAFAEMQQTWIDLATGNPAGCPEGRLCTTETLLRAPPPLPELAKSPDTAWWAQTTFHLPFMYTIGCEPFFDEHALVVLPFVRQAHIGQVKAWINGSPLEVRKYRYPRNPALSCYYADLVGSGAQGGENKLVVWFGRE